MTWPNLFLIAAPRSGSTQLARWLDTHPEIQLAPVKEPNHFSAHEFPADRVRSEHLDDVAPGSFAQHRGSRRRAQFAVFREAAHYRALFAPLTARWRCDASTSYLACPEAPAAIAAACGPAARAITLTRDPVERALSHHRLALRTGRIVAPLAEELEAEIAGRTPLHARYLLRPSRQAVGVARVARAFGPDRHLALAFEEVVADPAAALARVAAFLDLDSAGFDLRVEARNAGQPPRFPGLNRLLHTSGLKTRLRRLLPPAVKSRLKPLYFSAGAAPCTGAAERAALERALAGERREAA